MCKYDYTLVLFTKQNKLLYRVYKISIEPHFEPLTQKLQHITAGYEANRCSLTGSFCLGN